MYSCVHICQVPGLDDGGSGSAYISPHSPPPLVYMGGDDESRVRDMSADNADASAAVDGGAASAAAPRKTAARKSVGAEGNPTRVSRSRPTDEASEDLDKSGVTTVSDSDEDADESCTLEGDEGEKEEVVSDEKEESKKKKKTKTKQTKRAVGDAVEDDDEVSFPRRLSGRPTDVSEHDDEHDDDDDDDDDDDCVLGRLNLPTQPSKRQLRGPS
jgi:hypothetical protein